MGLPPAGNKCLSIDTNGSNLTLRSSSAIPGLNVGSPLSGSNEKSLRLKRKVTRMKASELSKIFGPRTQPPVWAGTHSLVNCKGSVSNFDRSQILHQDETRKKTIPTTGNVKMKKKEFVTCKPKRKQDLMSKSGRDEMIAARRKFCFTTAAKKSYDSTTKKLTRLVSY